MRYLLDSSTCIDVLRGHSRKTLDRLTAQPLDSVGLSSITLAQLWYGAARRPLVASRKELLLRFCAPLVILQFDDGAAQRYGHVRAELEANGTPIGPLDTLIAAHALHAGLTLVSGNPHEFRRVSGLRVEDWR